MGDTSNGFTMVWGLEGTNGMRVVAIEMVLGLHVEGRDTVQMAVSSV